jgi:hypothetical protein
LLGGKEGWCHMSEGDLEDGFRKVRCPVCRRVWIWEPSDPDVQPTRKGLCTCTECRELEHVRSANYGKPTKRLLGDEDPGVENTVRAMEDGL